MYAKSEKIFLYIFGTLLVLSSYPIFKQIFIFAKGQHIQYIADGAFYYIVSIIPMLLLLALIIVRIVFKKRDSLASDIIMLAGSLILIYIIIAPVVNVYQYYQELISSGVELVFEENVRKIFIPIIIFFAIIIVLTIVQIILFCLIKFRKYQDNEKIYLGKDIIYAVQYTLITVFYILMVIFANYMISKELY